jgi:hypothetical protein
MFLCLGSYAAVIFCLSGEETLPGSLNKSPPGIERQDWGATSEFGTARPTFLDSSNLQVEKKCKVTRSDRLAAKMRLVLRLSILILAGIRAHDLVRRGQGSVEDEKGRFAG